MVQVEGMKCRDPMSGGDTGGCNCGADLGWVYAHCGRASPCRGSGGRYCGGRRKWYYLTNPHAGSLRRHGIDGVGGGGRTSKGRGGDNGGWRQQY